MIGMIIADDELLIRQGLMTIPWDEYGIEVKGVASNGEEALAMVISQKPEILMTDIRMPGMYGLDLIKAAKSEVPDIKAILLTGYPDFNYAHTAIQLGAFDYILKPSDPDEIIQTVLRAKKQVEEEARQKAEGLKIKQIVSETRAVRMDSFLQSLIYQRNENSESISLKCSEFALALDHCVVMAAEFETEDGTLRPDLRNRLKEEISYLASGYYTFYSTDINQSTYCVIIESPMDETAVKEKMLLLAVEIRNRLKTKYETDVSIGISRLCTSPMNLHAAFNQAVNCLKMKFSLGRGAVIHVEELLDSVKRQDVFVLHLTDEILENMNAGQYRKVEELLRELLFRLAKEQKADEQMIKSICFNILLSSLRILNEEKSIVIRDMNEQVLNPMLTRCANVEELETFMLNTLMNLMDSVHSKVPAVKNKVITDVMAYIEKFYMQNISLISVSEYVHMNHIYISRLIKKETGETFLDILTRIRMNKACEFLAHTDMKTYEICDRIGIKDSGYFSQVFKKCYGVTPSEYREDLSSRHKGSAEEKR